MSAVSAGTGDIDTSQRRYWRDVKRGYVRFEEGDVLFAKITPCMENGKVAIARNLAGGRGAGSTEFHVVRPTRELLSAFLFYFLLQERVRMDARLHMTGAVGQLRVPSKWLSRLSIPVPPIVEQHRIVTAIEEHLSRLDAAVAAFKRVRRLLQPYRMSLRNDLVKVSWKRLMIFPMDGVSRRFLLLQNALTMVARPGHRAVEMSPYCAWAISRTANSS